MSSTTKSTPGPWQVVSNYRDRLAIVGPNNDGRSISSDRICNLPHRRNGEGVANAALVAASPVAADLLDEAEAYCPVELQDRIRAWRKAAGRS